MIVRLKATTTPRRRRSRVSNVRVLFFFLAGAVSSSVGGAATDNGSTSGTGTLVLSQSMMKLTHAAAELSRFMFLDDPAAEAFAEASDSVVDSSSSTTDAGWKRFQVFAVEPDLAVVAKRWGHCFAGFRGTYNEGSNAIQDWMQNLDVAPQQLCWTQEQERQDAVNSPSYSSSCCTVRRGFYAAYRNEFRRDLEDAVRECASDCTDPNECVVLTGHSQGGAVAAVAALHLADLNPYVITFGQPPAVDAPCPRITSPRWFRYVNSLGAGGGENGGDGESLSGIFSSSSNDDGIAYDIVPFVPTLGSASHFGHMIVLGEDPTTVVYAGLDAQTALGPRSVSAHGISTDLGRDTAPGYLDRLKAIRSHYDSVSPYPVRLAGYQTGSRCTADLECESRRCQRDTSGSWWALSSQTKRCTGATTSCTDDSQCSDSGGRCDGGTCLPKLGSCQICDEDSDCLSGTCGRWNRRCAAMNAGGLMDDLCYCARGSDCLSGRCEGIVPRVCQPRLASGAACTEDNDCLSGLCSWLFRCAGNDVDRTPTSTVTAASTASSSRSVERLPCSRGASSLRDHDRNLKRSKATLHVDDDSDASGIDDTEQPVDDDLGPESSNPLSRQILVEWCLVALAAAAVSVFVAIYCCTASAGRRQRVGYDEIPTQLTV